MRLMRHRFASQSPCNWLLMCDMRAAAYVMPQFFDSTDLLAFAGAVLSPESLHEDLPSRGSAHSPVPPASLLVVAGLDLDFARRPFGGVLQLAKAALDDDTWGGARGPMLAADASIHRLSARCARVVGGGVCGRQAPFSQRLHTGGMDTVLVGGGEYYQPACARHHTCEPADGGVWQSPVPSLRCA